MEEIVRAKIIELIQTNSTVRNSFVTKVMSLATSNLEIKNKLESIISDELENWTPPV